MRWGGGGEEGRGEGTGRIRKGNRDPAEGRDRGGIEGKIEHSKQESRSKVTGAERNMIMEGQLKRETYTTM